METQRITSTRASCLAVVALLGLLSASAAGLAVVRPLDVVAVQGSKVGASGPIARGTFEVEGSEASTSTTVLEILGPVLDGTSFSIHGMVAYEGIAGVGYLEMWTHFPDGSQYFSRTLAERGPMAKLQGESPERPFLLPFQSEAGMPPPARLVLNVVLPGMGRVVLRDLRYDGRAPAESSGAARSAWWSASEGGVVGGVLGSVVGLAGALVAALCGIGAGRRVAMPLLWVLLALGAGALLAGVVALSLRQPYEVWYPLLLGAVIDLPLAVFGLRIARRRFEEIELRRMQALDVG